MLNLLGCLFTSDTPLTCAFLKKHCMTKMNKMVSPPVPITGHVEPKSGFSVKVFVRKFDREILYAECREDFIDCLLTFLILPLELACSLSNDNTILVCVGNLCRSQCRRTLESNFCQYPDYYSCRNNSLLGYFSRAEPSYECLVPPNSYSGYSFASGIRRSLLSEGEKIVTVYPINPKDKAVSSPRYGAGFMKKNTKFIVSNDLNITPMNSSSTIGLLKKMKVDISDLEEHQIIISKAEVCLYYCIASFTFVLWYNPFCHCKFIYSAFVAQLISILRASLISSSALTNGLSSLLVKKPKEET